MVSYDMLLHNNQGNYTMLKTHMYLMHDFTTTPKHIAKLNSYIINIHI